MRYLLPLLVSHVLVAAVVLSGPAAAVDCPCPCECTDTGDTGGPPVDTSNTDTADQALVVAMGGQSNCVKPTLATPVTVPLGARYVVDGVERTTVTSGALELPWLAVGATVYKRCRNGINLATWQADYLPGLLSDLGGEAPDVLLWVHGERDSAVQTLTDTYADRLAPTLTEIGAPVVYWPVLSGPGLNQGRIAIINADVPLLPTIEAVPTADLEHQEDGLHFTEPSAHILADRVFQAWMESTP